MNPLPESPGTDPWQDSVPPCRIYARTQQFKQLLSDLLGARIRLLDTEPADAREAVLVDCLQSGEMLRAAREQFPARPLVGVVPKRDAMRIVEVLAGGADGVVALTDPPTAWRECLMVVLGGGRWLGGPGIEISLDHKYTDYDVARGGTHSGDVTMRTKLFVKDRVGDKFRS